MFNAMYKLKGFFKKYKKSNFLAIFFLLISYFVTFYKPYLIGQVSDAIATGDYSYELLYKWILLFAFLILSNFFINVGWSFNLYKNIYLISRDTRNMLMKKYLNQFPRFFEKNSTGSLMGKATNDIQMMANIVGYGIMLLFDAIIYPIVLLLVMFFISWKITLIVVLTLPFFIYFLYKIGLKLEDIYRRLQESFDRMNDITLESISSIKVIRGFNVEKVFKNRFKKRVEDNMKRDMDKNSLQNIYMPSSNFYNAALMTIAIIGGSFLIRKGEMTLGTMVTYTFYMQNLSWPAFALSDFLVIGKEGGTSIKRIEEIMKYEEDVKDKEFPEKLESGNTFTMKNFSFKYPSSERHILEDINLEFEKGDTVILVGKTGSGKTTFLKQFLRLYDDYEGILNINDIPIEDYERESLMGKIGYVPQDNYLFSKSIRDNINLFRDFSDEEILKATKLADFKKDLETFPKGLDTMTGEKGVALSGGQRQRIALARALIEESEILILDDVFSAVDTKTEEKIIENLENYRENKTNIFATHRLSVIKPDDIVVVLDNGKIEAKGTHDEVYNSSDWYKEQYDTQFMEVEDA